MPALPCWPTSPPAPQRSATPRSTPTPADAAPTTFDTSWSPPTCSRPATNPWPASRPGWPPVLAEVQQPEHRRLLHAYATWRVLRRLRRRAARNSSRTDPDRLLPHPAARRHPVPRLARPDAASRWPNAANAMSTPGSPKGPAGYPVRDFLGWAAEHHHCPAMLVPALGRTTGAATEADERWALVARLLHDDTLELTDRVAGAFLLCYGQQLSRIAVMTTEQVHRHDDPDVVSLRFGAHDHDRPAAAVGPAHRTDRCRPQPPPRCRLARHQPMAVPRAPTRTAHHRLPPRRTPPSCSASEPSPARRATLLQLAAEVPAAVLAELLHLTPATATRWTRDAAGDWSRYAADLASRARSPDHEE